MCDRRARWVIEEREIWACAHLVMRRYGNAARSHALHRADALLAHDDEEGQRTLLRILDRIQALEKAQPEGRLQ